MTTQIRRFVELTDVLGLHFRCNACDATLSLTRQECLRGSRAARLSECPACGQPWAAVNGSTCEPVVIQVMSAIDKAVHTLGKTPGSFPAGFSMMLEVKYEKED